MSASSEQERAQDGTALTVESGGWDFLASLGEPSRAGLARPFVVGEGSRRRTVATNGIALLAVVGEHAGANVEERHPGAPVERAAMMLDSAPEPTTTLSLAALRAALDVTSDVATCAKCDGKGGGDCPDCEGEGERECECFDCGNEHTVECKTCRGKGTIACTACSSDSATWADKTEPVRIGSQVFNAFTIAPYVRHLPDDVVGFANGISPKNVGHESAAAMHGDGWTLLLMPLIRYEGKTPKTFPLADQPNASAPSPERSV